MYMVEGKNYWWRSLILWCLSGSSGMFYRRLKTSQRMWEASRWQTDVVKGKENRMNTDSSLPSWLSGKQPMAAPVCSSLCRAGDREHPALGDEDEWPTQSRTHYLRAWTKDLSFLGPQGSCHGSHGPRLLWVRRQPHRGKPFSMTTNRYQGIQKKNRIS